MVVIITTGVIKAGMCFRHCEELSCFRIRQGNEVLLLSDLKNPSQGAGK
jgi:hypothetical protein